jgi:hypothetical protein
MLKNKIIIQIKKMTIQNILDHFQQERDRIEQVIYAALYNNYQNLSPILIRLDESIAKTSRFNFLKRHKLITERREMFAYSQKLVDNMDRLIGFGYTRN